MSPWDLGPVKCLIVTQTLGTQMMSAVTQTFGTQVLGSTIPGPE